MAKNSKLFQFPIVLVHKDRSIQLGFTHFKDLTLLQVSNLPKGAYELLLLDTFETDRVATYKQLIPGYIFPFSSLVSKFELTFPAKRKSKPAYAVIAQFSI